MGGRGELRERVGWRWKQDARLKTVGPWHYYVDAFSHAEWASSLEGP